MTEFADNALTTLDTANAELGYNTGEDATRDTRIIRYINAGSQLFETMCGKKFFHVADETTRVRGFNDPRLVVSGHLPLSSVNKIEYKDGDSTTLIDADDYRIEDADKGFIERTDGNNWSSTAHNETNVSTHFVPGSERYWYYVTYTGGYVTPHQQAHGTFASRDLPHDIEEAVIQYVRMKDSQNQANPIVDSIGVDEITIDYVTHGNQRIAVPAEFRSAVEHYRRLPIR